MKYFSRGSEAGAITSQAIIQLHLLHTHTNVCIRGPRRGPKGRRWRARSRTRDGVGIFHILYANDYPLIRFNLD